MKEIITLKIREILVAIMIVIGGVMVATINPTDSARYIGIAVLNFGLGMIASAGSSIITIIEVAKRKYMEQNPIHVKEVDGN